MSPPSDSSAADIADQARHWLVALASGTMDEKWMLAFEHWLAQPGHRAVFEHERLLWRSLGPRPPASVAAPPRRARWRPRLAVAAAAVLACVLVWPELGLRLRADHRSDEAIVNVALPDGSRAVLDAGSAIAVHYDAQVRRIELLRGRAWFEVAPGVQAPFRVTTGDGVVEDIATAFVVARDGDAVDAVVEQGRVRVASRAGQDWTYLSTGQGVRWQGSARPQRQPDRRHEDIAAWRHGELLLDAVPVPEAIAELQRYRSGRILVGGDLSALPRVNAAFRTDRPDEALDALAASSGLVVTRLPLGVVLVRRGG